MLGSRILYYSVLWGWVLDCIRISKEFLLDFTPASSGPKRDGFPFLTHSQAMLTLLVKIYTWWTTALLQRPLAHWLNEDHSHVCLCIVLNILNYFQMFQKWKISHKNAGFWLISTRKNFAGAKQQLLQLVKVCVPVQVITTQPALSTST